MMDKIPEDIRETSYKVAADIATSRFKTSHLIARAILAERKRCAEVAKRMLVYADTTSRSDEEIYRAIMEPRA